MRFLNWLIARLARPKAGHAVIAFTLVLVLPALFSPRVWDDYAQAMKWTEMRENQKGLGSFLSDCFVFASGDPVANHHLMEHKFGEWWMAPDFKHAFFRPLSAVTHAIDFSLWPGSSALMHLHTLLWFLGLLLILRTLYQRLLTPRVALLAFALSAWDDAHGTLLSLTSNRNALIAGVFGVATIIVHDRWRRDGWRIGAWLGPILFVFGLLSAEMAVATTAFLFAYALCLDQGSLAHRMARLIPYLLVAVVWQTAYIARGYGAQGSGFYQHPLSEPLTFAAKLFERAPIFVLGQLTPVPADTWMLYSTAVKVVVFALTIAMLVIVARIAWPRLGSSPEARFWLIGAGLSLVPISATFPSDRDLVFVGLGAAPALAILFKSVLDHPLTSRWPRFVVGTLVVFNLILAPLLLPAKCLTTLGMQSMGKSVDEIVPRDSTISEKTLVVVWSSSQLPLVSSWSRRDAEGTPKPRRTRLLAISPPNVSVTRVDETTLRIRPDQGFMPRELEQYKRGPTRPFHIGEVVELSDMKATVTELTNDRRPKTVEFRFAAPLSSPEWLWMRGEGMRLVGWTPPNLGETVVVKEVH